MKVNTEWFDHLHHAISLFKDLLSIQERQPTPEESKALMIALSDMGLSKEVIEENSLKAVQIQMGRYLNELLMTFSEVDNFNPLIPSSCESVLADLRDKLSSKSETLRDFFNKDEFDSKELILFFTPLPNDTLSHSEVYDEYKSLFRLFVEELIVLVESDLTRENKLNDFERRLEEAEITDYTLRFFDLVDYQEETPMNVSLGTLKDRIDRVDQLVVEGLESFSNLVDDHFNHPDVAGMEANWWDSLKSGLKKTSDAIVAAIKSLVTFFTGQKKDLSARKDELIETCQKQVDALKQLDQNTAELDKDVIAKTKSMFEKAELTECAGFFGSVNDISGAIGAFNSAISWLKQNADKTDDADKALNEAQKAADDLSKFNPSADSETSGEEKSAIQEEKNTLVTKAKEMMAGARTKLKESLTPVSALSKLPAIIKASVKSKPKEEVAGTESWML